GGHVPRNHQRRFAFFLPKADTSRDEEHILRSVAIELEFERRHESAKAVERCFSLLSLECEGRHLQPFCEAWDVEARGHPVSLSGGAWWRKLAVDGSAHARRVPPTCSHVVFWSSRPIAKRGTDRL